MNPVFGASQAFQYRPAATRFGQSASVAEEQKTYNSSQIYQLHGVDIREGTKMMGFKETFSGSGEYVVDDSILMRVDSLDVQKGKRGKINPFHGKVNVSFFQKTGEDHYAATQVKPENYDFTFDIGPSNAYVAVEADGVRGGTVQQLQNIQYKY